MNNRNYKLTAAGNRGFSLLELMVAMSLLTVGLMGISPLLIVAVENADLNRSSAMSVELARGKIEELRSSYRHKLLTGNDPANIAVGWHGPERVVLGMTGNADEPPRSFSLRWQVTDLSQERLEVTVQVRPEEFLDPESQAPRRAKTVVMTGAFAP